MLWFQPETSINLSVTLGGDLTPHYEAAVSLQVCLQCGYFHCNHWNILNFNEPKLFLWIGLDSNYSENAIRFAQVPSEIINRSKLWLEIYNILWAITIIYVYGLFPQKYQSSMGSSSNCCY